MADIFEITMLPASEGDCLVIRYGQVGRENRVIIDGGRKATYKELLKALPAPADRNIELLVITHVDRDHIEGTIDLLEDDQSHFTFGDVWFNGYDHLEWDPEIESFGAQQGERVTIALQGDRLPWNEAFDGGPVRIEGGQPLPSRELSGGLKLTLLSPNADKLLKLKPQWIKECEKAGILPGGKGEEPKVKASNDLEEFGGKSLTELAADRRGPDSTKPNGSSIAMVAEFAGKRVLLAADAHPDLLLSSLKELGGGEPVRFDLVKLSHHGSRANTTNSLAKQLNCERYLVSTSGSYFGHPDIEALARVVLKQPANVTFYFNYEQPHVRQFADLSGTEDKTFSCVFPANEGERVTISV